MKPGLACHVNGWIPGASVRIRTLGTARRGRNRTVAEEVTTPQVIETATAPGQTS